ncbi:hypothetical protein FIBSPDRAFT_827846 [Athelia psychrophila]|uniref:Uncharacterized protein n=1 Tax=Athelia psychrophila TaxID=1759441 RepID=A0A166I9F3_9AGAM|nr:hypothetical protein FIBSPDRAFT_827846 [Fibularhizoctonia sp. CBS 109695]
MVFGFMNGSQRTSATKFASSDTDSQMGEHTGFLTPKSSRPSSPARPGLIINTEANKASPQKPPSPPLTPAEPSIDSSVQDHMDNYRSSIQSTLNTLGITFTVLGEQAAKYSELGPAIDAGQKLSAISKELNAQYDRQDDALRNMKERLSTMYRGELARNLNAHVENRVQAKIAERVQEKVREQLLKQVPASLGQEITSHKRQVLQIQTTLHNSEARRHNALLHIQDGSELLRPLRRPFEQASPASLLPTPNSSPKSSPASALESLEPPTPSPFFPIDVAHLIDLSPTEARKLVIDYGLDLEKPPRAGGPDSAFHEKNSNLNRFLAHIGAPYQLLHNATSPATPLITRATW